MYFVRAGQLNETILWIGFLGLAVILLAMLVLMFIIAFQLRKTISVLEKISISMVDIFEILFSNKEHNLKMLKAVNQLNTLTESQPSTLNSMANALFQIQSSLELQAGALKKINNNIVTMYKNILSKTGPDEHQE